MRAVALAPARPELTSLAGGVVFFCWRLFCCWALALGTKRGHSSVIRRRPLARSRALSATQLITAEEKPQRGLRLGFWSDVSRITKDRPKANACNILPVFCRGRTAPAQRIFFFRMGKTGTIPAIIFFRARPQPPRILFFRSGAPALYY